MTGDGDSGNGADLRAENAMGFAKSCSELGVPLAPEVSRSGEGAHAWAFLTSITPIPTQQSWPVFLCGGMVRRLLLQHNSMDCRSKPVGSALGPTRISTSPASNKGCRSGPR